MAGSPTYGRPISRRSMVTDDAPLFWRSVGKWGVGFALFLALAALMTSLQLFQVTAEGASKRTLRRSVAALTEIDPLIERNYDDLQQQAAAAAPGDTVQLKNFPIAIPLKPEEVRGQSKQQVRDLIIDRSADLMYAHGTEPLRLNPKSSQDVGLFTVGGITDTGLDFLRSRHHDLLGVLTFVFAAICAFLGVTLAALCRGFGRLASVGGVVLAVAIPVLFGGIGARFYMRIVSEGETEYIQHEFLLIGQGLAWIPIRDGAAFAVFGAALLIIGVACAAWADRHATPPSVR
jgi:hypothetical protein